MLSMQLRPAIRLVNRLEEVKETHGEDSDEFADLSEQLISELRTLDDKKLKSLKKLANKEILKTAVAIAS